MTVLAARPNTMAENFCDAPDALCCASVSLYTFKRISNWVSSRRMGSDLELVKE